VAAAEASRRTLPTQLSYRHEIELVINLKVAKALDAANGLRSGRARKRLA
jgi:hypothetical protein